MFSLRLISSAYNLQVEKPSVLHRKYVHRNLWSYLIFFLSCLMHIQLAHTEGQISGNVNGNRKV
jgi:hypothetical protein